MLGPQTRTISPPRTTMQTATIMTTTIDPMWLTHVLGEVLYG